MPAIGQNPSARVFCSIVFYNNSLYLTGYASFSLDPQNDIYKFDLDKEIWELIEVNGQKPSPRLGHYAVVHNDEMVIIYGFVEETLDDFTEMYKFNFETKTWTQNEQFRGNIVVGASMAKVNSKVYLLYGRSGSKVYNSIQVIDLDEEFPVANKITQDFLSPPARANHCAVVIGQYMYMFGGDYYDNNREKGYFNDFWRFDLEGLFWEPIIISGTQPFNRGDYACCKLGADRIAVFGGEYESLFYNELFIFYEPFLSWQKIESENEVISPRAGSCITAYDNFLFIIGGMNKDYGFSDIWAFDLELNLYRLIGNGFLKEEIINSKCWVESGDINKLVVIGGSDFLSIPNFYIYEINMNLKD